MLKPLHKSDTKSSPFIMTKDWNLSNTFNDWVVLTEHSGGLPVAAEYAEYIDSELTISINSSCNVALEQQDGDKIRVRKGKKSSGIFYPDTEELNLDGTYKRIVHSQIRNMFYNSFRDPTQIWGLEYLDFENSQTKRFLGDGFVLYDVPTDVFGEKVLENSVVIYDRVSDDNYTIIDDGRGNLMAVRNLFSKKQELGEFSNEFLSGSSGYCNGYFGWPSLFVDVSYEDSGSAFSLGLVFGSAVSTASSDSFGMDVGLVSGEVVLTVYSSSTAESGSTYLSFLSGSLENVVYPISASETSSAMISFLSGSLVTLILPTSASETSSVMMGFYIGSASMIVITQSYADDNNTFTVGLSSGSLG